MSNLFYTLRPPPGIVLNQHVDGSIRITYALVNLAALRAVMDTAAKDLLDVELQHLEAVKSQEIAKQQIPPTKLQELDAQIAALQTQRAAEIAATAVPAAIPETPVTVTTTALPAVPLTAVPAIPKAAPKPPEPVTINGKTVVVPQS